MISPEDFLKHSNQLYKLDEKSEILLRNVARNSYYALYHQLVKIDGLPTLDKNKNEFGSHESLIQQLRMSKDPSFREWGLTLANLKATRTKADYKIRVPFSDHDARKSIRIVEKTFAEITVKNNDEVNTEKCKKVIKPTIHPLSKCSTLRIIK